MTGAGFICIFLLLLSACGGPALPEYSAVPDFALTERSGREVTRQELSGHVWIADFIFTRCSGICPAMSSNMKKLQERLPKEIRLVSFSVDPEHDTLEVLTEYARRYEADPERWLFLTGDTPTMQKLSVEGFKLAMDPTSGTKIEPILHSSRFVLVDRKGKIRGYYGMEDPDALDRLAADVRKLF
jgi:protein SCO1/2